MKIHYKKIEEKIKRFFVLSEVETEIIGIREWRITDYAATSIKDAIHIEYEYPPDKPDYTPDTATFADFRNVEERALNKAFSYLSTKGRIITIEKWDNNSYMVYVELNDL